MIDRIRYSTIQTGLLLFWAIWLTLIVATNIFDGLRSLGMLPDGWTFASYNHDLVVSTVATQGLPAAVGSLLFVGAVLWELLAAGLFWRAFLAMNHGEPGTGPRVTQAFAVSLALWAAFLIATEAMVSYATAATHKGTLIAQLASLVVIRGGLGSTNRGGLEP